MATAGETRERSASAGERWYARLACDQAVEHGHHAGRYRAFQRSRQTARIVTARIVMFVLGLARGQSWTMLFNTAVALAIAAIPLAPSTARYRSADRWAAGLAFLAAVVLLLGWEAGKWIARRITPAQRPAGPAG